MEKVQSLAEFLGTADPKQPGAPVAPAPSPKMTAKAFCKEILNTQQYRESLLRRILLDELPPAVECLLYHYAHGKPIEYVEIKDTTDDVDEMSVEQCENEAMRLLAIARQLRTEGMTGDDASIH